MKKLIATMVVLSVLGVTGCNEKKTPSAQPTAATSSPSVSAGEGETSPVTDENYALAETQVIFADYVKKIAAATGTDGVGVFMHNEKGADPKDKTIMRSNFDTLYSFALLDLAEPAILTMPETDGRYQSAWFIDEDHYNPYALTTPGEHEITQENVGNRYVMIVIRTQANTADPADVAKANDLQEGLKLEQKDKGSYVPSKHWNMDDILATRAKYMKIAEDEGIKSDVMFGKRGEVPAKEHNAGTAYGWGGFTPNQAVYPLYAPTSTDPQTITLKDVPAAAFWSVTIYDAEGFPQGDVYNINSQFAVPNEDGSYTIHFGGDKKAANYLDIFEGWNFALRLYQPTEPYFDGTWVKPELQMAK